MHENKLKVAAELHYLTNHFYSGYLPYEYHLKLALQFGLKFQELLPSSDRETVITAILFHDCLEDTRTSYRDLEKILSQFKDINIDLCAELVYAVTNEKGKTRKERANDKYYAGIRETKYAIFVKLCDRMSNIFYGQVFNSSMVSMYQKEHDFFTNALLINAVNSEINYESMFSYLRYLTFEYKL